MQIVKDKITLQELHTMSEKMFQKLVKAVVDIEQEIMAVDAPMHSDQEELLLEEGSLQENLWGINFHPNNFPHENWVEFDSMINIRPALDNRSRYVHDPKIRAKILSIVKKLVIQ
jgi:hypothetical protein